MLDILEIFFIRLPQFKNQKQNIIDSFESYDESQQTLENFVEILSMVQNANTDIIDINDMKFDIMGRNGDFISTYDHKIKQINYHLIWWGENLLFCQDVVNKLNFEKELLLICFEKYKAYKKCLANKETFYIREMSEYHVIIDILEILSNQKDIETKIKMLDVYKNNSDAILTIFLEGNQYYKTKMVEYLFANLKK